MNIALRICSLVLGLEPKADVVCLFAPNALVLPKTGFAVEPDCCARIFVPVDGVELA